MTRIAIIESNPPDWNAREIAGGIPLWSQIYATTLRHFAPDLEIAVVQPYAGETLDAAGFDAVVFTGSSVDWSVNQPKERPLVEAMEACFAAGRPMLGSCNGYQLAAHLLGGVVAASPNGAEHGLARDLRLTKAGLSHPMMAGRRDGFAVPCVHRDEIQTLPEGAVLLAGNAHSPVQAFAYARNGVDFWGVQYHPEMPARQMAERLKVMSGMAAVDLSDLSNCSTDRTAAERLGTTPEEMQTDMRATEIRNWLDHIGAL